MLYMRKIAQVYSESAMEEILKNRKYKKLTIAFMAVFLNYHHVNHTLDKYLSTMSDYKILNMEVLYEFV